MNYQIEFSVGNHLTEIEEEIVNWQKEKKVERLWTGDASLWTNQDENKWLGWLNVLESTRNEIPRIEMLANEIKTEVTHIVLLGMGGSSLFPDMLAKTYGKIDSYPELHILDSTDPLQILHLEKKIDLLKTFFIVSSKSGTTLESTILKDYFYAKLQTLLKQEMVGHHFMAITDPGSALHVQAKKEKFKAIFDGVPSIGGRYSALSVFGMVPAGLMGLKVNDFLNHANEMRQACLPQVSARNNPGIVLGIILGICAQRGKDKITFVISPQIQELGPWLEQLLAESTGKQGKGLIPIDQEFLGDPEVYGQDRVFVYIRLDEAPDSIQDAAVARIEKAGFVTIRLQVSQKMHLGAELFLWEIATAVASSIIGVNPFDQPDVEASKKRALQLTNEVKEISLIPKNHLIGIENIQTDLQAHLSRINAGDYVVISAFIEMTKEHTFLLQQFRNLIRNQKKVATGLGFGPRFLHSTGQLYKGGSNTGLFIQITADHPDDIQVPIRPYTFGVVIDAQAQADFEVLNQRFRRVLRIHLGKDVDKGLQQLLNILRT